MPSTSELFREAVGEIQQWLALLSQPGEAVVRQAIALRLLQAAGFDIWNPAEVVPEETNLTGNRADFLIRAGKGKFPLEIKGMNVSLQPVHYQQVVAYAANEGTRWAMLTNGRIWVVLDRTHNPGGTFLDHEVLKLELAQEGQTFAEDLSTILDSRVWRADAFGPAVEAVQQRQQQRRDEWRIEQEKRPIVAATQEEFGIATFEKAAAAAVQMGRITELERDVLLGKSLKWEAVVPLKKAPSRRVPPAPTLHPYAVKNAPHLSPDQGEVLFVYCIKEAEAQVIYQPTQGTWTVRAGSTALQEVSGAGREVDDLRRRRVEWLADGTLQEMGSGLLRYEKDVRYSTPSRAAGDIGGKSWHTVGGWDAWKDAEGRSAQHYRPKNQPG